MALKTLAEMDSQTRADVEVLLRLYPIVTLQYSSTALYQVSYHIQ